MGTNDQLIEERRTNIREKKREIKRLEEEIKELQTVNAMSPEEWSELCKDKPVNEWPPLPEVIDYVYYKENGIVLADAGRFFKVFARGYVK